MSSAASNSSINPERAQESAVRIWDWPVRIVHWSFVVVLPVQWWTHDSGLMSVHETVGYVALGLVIFRVYWGCAGSSTARFSNFVKGPRAVSQHVRILLSGTRKPVIGHNPLGGLSVLALLGLLALQVILGLFADDVDGIVSGSLARYVSYGVASDAREWHEATFNILLAFVALHIAAIMFYATYGKDNLIKPMLSGYKRMSIPQVQATFAPAWRLWAGLVFSAALAYWVSRGLPFP